MQEVIEFEYNGYKATVIRPENPNGKWVWKTEFLYAFDKAEVELLKTGYTRVYYSISEQYGSYDAVRLMRNFYKYVIEKYSLNKKCSLFGFSRGGLYAINYALFYPESVNCIYLDAPVVDFRTWPNDDYPDEKKSLLKSYSINEEVLKEFKGNPIFHIKDLYELRIPLLIVAGDSDATVPYELNAKKIVDFYREKGVDLPLYLKKGCNHHPHSLEDVSPVIDFVENCNK